jgi:hypothetical protein
METDWENPEAKKERKKQSVMEAKQKGFYSQLASNGNAPSELKEMMVKSKPRPRPRKRFGFF